MNAKSNAREGDGVADHLAVLDRLRKALPTVGLNGWVHGVKALDWAIAELTAMQAQQGAVYRQVAKDAPIGICLPDIGSRWRVKSYPSRVATVTEVRDGYLRFSAPWMKDGEGGKALDAFLAHYDPAGAPR